MGSVVLRPRARIDLGAIWDYVADVAPEHADALLRQLDATMRVLSANPLMGRPRDELLSELRSFAVGPYVVFYRPHARGIEVIRILHGARDIPSIFGE